MSLNETFLVAPTIHPPLLDVLLCFRAHQVALTTDVSKMYRAVKLIDSDKDLHRFVWRSCPDDPLIDYHMTRVTFGVSASSFAANMAVRQNAEDFADEFSLAAKAVCESFYVDDGLTDSDSVADAIKLQKICSLGGSFFFANGILIIRRFWITFLLISENNGWSALYLLQQNTWFGMELSSRLVSTYNFGSS